MARQRLLFILRLAIPGLCAVGLFVGILLTVQKGIGRGDSERSQRSDPGLRVLMTPHPRVEGDPFHRQVTFEVVQASLLYAPDAHKNQYLELPTGSQVQLQPSLDGGVLVKRLDVVGPTLSWPHTKLRLVPSRRIWSDSKPRAKESLLQALEGSNYEAEDRRAVARLENRSLRGSFDILVVGARSLAVVNRLPIEAWLEGVLAAEMKASYPVETLKAQAVVARTWALWRIMSGGRLVSQVPVDVFDGNDDPAYEGTGEGGQNIVSALEETRGKPLLYVGRPFPAFYHAASGGRLAAVSEVFPHISGLSGESLGGVMPGGEDPDCDRGLNAMGAKERLGTTTVSFSSADLRSRLIQRDPEAGYIRDVIPDGKTPGRPYRVKRIALVARLGRNVILGPEDFRTLLGTDKIPSMLWSDTSPSLIEPANFTWKVVTYGRGHGVGMSQVSAYAMAKQHLKYQEILARFYKGTKIGSAQW